MLDIPVVIIYSLIPFILFLISYFAGMNAFYISFALLFFMFGVLPIIISTLYEIRYS